MAGEGERDSHHCAFDPCVHAENCLVVNLTVVLVVRECVVALSVVSFKYIRVH